ncbi:MAG: hypothetical protein U5K75_03410 [Ahrensia sp.]|nr:hypothetical protein [Ahrensia sp.]
MGHPPEPGTAKVKLSHHLDDGSKIEFETHVEVADFTKAVSEAEHQFKAAVAQLAAGNLPHMRNVKVEM